MTATGHAIIGTVIAAKIANPALAIPVAILSHIAADICPHWDSGTNGKNKSGKRLFVESSIDVTVGFIVAYFLILFLFPQTNLLYAFVIIIAAQLLDWISAPSFIFHFKKIPFSWIYRFQSRFNSRLDKPWGIISQALVLVPLVLLAKIF